MNCDILLNVNGTTETFHSDEALDVYLFKHRDAFSDKLKVVDPTLSASSTIERLEEYKKDFKVPTPHVGVNNAWKYVNDTVIEEFDESGYKEWFKQSKLDEGYEPEKIDDLFEKERNKYADIGSDIHYGLQAYFDDDVTINSSNLKRLSAGDVINISKRIGVKVSAYLDKAFGVGKWKTYSEFKVSTNNLDEGKLREINDKLKALGEPEVKDLYGIIDMIVLDDSGSLHLYDFKTSKRSFQEWNSRKVNATNLQLETYAAILRQMGYNVKTTNVITIDADPDKTTASFNGIYQIPYNANIISQVNTFVPNIIETNIDNLQRTNAVMRTIAPSANVDTISVRKNAEIEHYRKKVYSLRPDMELAKDPRAINAKYYFWNTLTNTPVFCKNEDDVTNKLGSFINAINESRGKELKTFGNNLYTWIKTRNLDALEQYVRTENTAVSKHLIRQFKKYIVNGWNLINDDVLFENGMLLFEKGGRVEIVITDVLSLNTIIPLKNGKGILSERRAATDIVDNSVVLDSRRGHLLLMKAMSFISENQDVFKNRKIQAIKAVNLHSVETVTASNSKLCENWKLLGATFLDLNLKLLGTNVFMKDINSFLQQANDHILSGEYIGLSTTASKLKFRNPEYLQDIDREFTREELIGFIKSYQGDLGLYKLESMSSDDWQLQAFNMLLQAYLSTFNVSLSAQEDLGTIWSGKKGFHGTKTSPFGVSESGTLRSVEEINSLFERNVEQEYKKAITPWQLSLKKMFDKSDRYSSIKGNSSFFENWFVKDGDKIDERFILKDPSEIDPSEAPALKLFLETLATFRGYDTPEKISNAKASGEYYKVPLIKGKMFETISHKGGIINSLKSYVNRIAKVDFEEALGLTLSDSQKRALNDLSILEIDNSILNMENDYRERLITDNGVGSYSTDLDLIFLITAATSIRSKLSKTYIPALTAFRVYLEMESATNSGNTNTNTKNAVTDWMKSVVYGKSLIDPHQMFWVKLSSVLKSAISGMTLGLSTTSFTREGLTSTITNFINSQNGLDPDIEAKALADAYKDIVKELGTTMDITSKDQQFNTLFGVAEMSFEQMASSNRTNPYGLGNIDSDIWYVTSTAMDYAHRNAIVKAKLIKRGAYDAYSINEQGELVYDFKKDKQWELIRKYKTANDCPDNLRSEWFKQDDHYRASIESWNNFQGMHLKYGDELPQALNPQELDGLRIFVNLLHGFYDNSQKILLQKELLGSLFLQFKTVPMARLQMQNHPTQAINIKQRRPVKDTETGKQIYEVIDEESNFVTGFMLEGDEKLQDLIKKGLARPYYVSMGNPLIGKVEETLNAAGTVIKCAKDGNFAALEEHFNDPFKRRTLFIALWDLLGLSIISFLLGIAFEDTENDYKNAEAYERFAYTVLTGAAQDGPVWGVAKSIIGDGTLPMLGIMSRYITTAQSVISGNTPALYGILNSFGATRPFASIAY